MCQGKTLMHRPGDRALGLISGKRQHGDHVAQWRRLVKRQVTGREEKGRRTALESWSGQPGGGRRASLDRSGNHLSCMLLAPVHSLDPRWEWNQLGGNFNECRQRAYFQEHETPPDCSCYFPKTLLASISTSINREPSITQ